MGSDIIMIVNSFSAGIVFCATVTIFMIGWKVLNTRFFAIFWSVIFLFSLSYVLNMKFQELDFAVVLLQFYIPVFYLLYMMVVKNNIFRMRYLLIMLIPVPLFIPSLLFVHHMHSGFIYIVYHLAVWSLLSVYSSIVIKKKKYGQGTGEENKVKLMIILTLVSVMPFIILNLIIGIFFVKQVMIFDILPPCLAAASFLMILFTFKNHIVDINEDYNASIGFLKKSLGIEKRTIIEKLSANLIHEIKNPISAIQSLNQQLLKRSENMEQRQVKKYLSIMGDELDRLKNLSESYLKNIRAEDTGEKRNIVIGEMLSSVRKLFDIELVKKDINLSVEKRLDNIGILFNEGYLRQIFINLVYNSIQANARNINIYVHNSIIRETYPLNIFFEDDGEGINEDDRKSIFKPFFSTKTDGTGLGLSICKEILNENLGDIELAADCAGGNNQTVKKTVFKLTFVNSVNKERQ